MQSHSFLKLIKPFCYTEDKNLSFCDTQKHYKTDINNDFLFKVTNALGVEQCGQLNKILINSSKSINISNSLFAKILGTIDEYSNAMRTNYDKDGFFPKSKAQILIDDQNDKKVKISDNKLDIENDACAKVEVSISKYTKVYDKLSQDQPKAQSYNAPLKDPKSNNSNIKSSKSLVTKNKVIEKSQNFEDIISDNNHLEISFSHEQRNQSNYIPRLGEGNDYADY